MAHTMCIGRRCLRLVAPFIALVGGACVLLCARPADAAIAQRVGYAGDPFDCEFQAFFSGAPPSATMAATSELSSSALDCEGCVYAQWIIAGFEPLHRLETPYAVRMVYYLNGITPHNVAALFMPKATQDKFAPGFGLPINASALARAVAITPAFRSTVLSYALAAVWRAVDPDAEKATTTTNRLLEQLGLDPAYKDRSDFTKAADLGNAIGAAVAAYAAADGWNADGRLLRSGVGATPFEDYTNFVPANTAYVLRRLTKWQPALETDGMGSFRPQQHVAAQLRRGAATLKPYCCDPQGFFSNHTTTVPYSDADDLAPSAFYRAQADLVLAASAALNDERKMLAQLFDVKNHGFAVAPGLLSTQFTGIPLTNLTIMALSVFEGHNMVLFDAMLAAFALKPALNAVRPFSAIRHLYANASVTAWAGPNKGTQTFPGSRWQSYLRTQPHADWPSATACTCQAFAEWWELYCIKELKLKGFVYSAFISQGCSMVEPGVVPAASFNKTWTSKDKFIADCGASRVWAGVHFPAAVQAGFDACRGIGVKVWARQQQMLGRA